jgi:hypothetical protein
MRYGGLRRRVDGGADTCLVALVHAGGDVHGLSADGDLHTARLAVEALERGVVADVEDLRADELGDRGVGVGAHLAGDHDQAGGQQRLHRDPEVLPVLVVLQQVVEHRVADGVGDLVRVTFGH